MKNEKTKTLVFAAMFAAIIMVLTTYGQIKTGVNDGYIHFGDSMIYLAACMLPAPYAMCAASIGASLSDILSGSAVWAPATAIIKAPNVIPFALMIKHLRKNGKDANIINKGTIIMAVVSGIITILGYFVAEGIMFGFKVAAVSSILRGLVQPVGSAIVFYAVGMALDKAKFKSRVIGNL